MKVRFFTFSPAKDATVSFKEAFDQIIKIPQSSEKRANSLALYGTIRIDKLQVAKDSVYALNWVRIRDTKLPAIANKKGKLDPIEIADDEGIGEETAVLFDVKTGRVAVQSSQYGLSANAIALAIEKLAPDLGLIEVEAVLNRDALNKIASMNYVLSYSVSLGATKDASIVSKFGAGVQDTLELLDTGLEAKMNLEVKLDRPSKNFQGISGKKVIGRIRDFWSQRESKEIEDIKVKGQLASGKVEIVDVMGWQMVAEVNVEQDKYRRLPYKSRIEAMYKIWSR